MLKYCEKFLLLLLNVLFTKVAGPVIKGHGETIDKNP